MHWDFQYTKSKNTFKSYILRCWILKLINLVEVLNILLFINSLMSIFLTLPEDLFDTFDFSKISHLFNTIRESWLGLLKVSSVNTKTYGLRSFSRLSVVNSTVEPPSGRAFPDINLNLIEISNLKFCLTFVLYLYFILCIYKISNKREDFTCFKKFEF